MRVTPSQLADCLVFAPTRFHDSRGFFQELYRTADYAAAGINEPLVQDNWSRSVKGVLRGMHFQRSAPQGKLVSVLRGEIYDVAVDIRKSSPTFGQWEGVHLSADNHKQLWVPPGFAHGFVVLSDSADFLYKTTDYYAPAHERCIAWNDPAIGITWPPGLQPKLSAKDQAATPLAEAEL